MESGVIKSYIWTFVNRFLHFFFIISLSLTYLCAQLQEWNFHYLFGILLGCGILMRIIWGFIGTKYSRFCDFNIWGVFEYCLTFFKNKKLYTGHNPASSIAILCILFLGFLTFLSGLLQYGAEENKGIFAFLFLHYSYFKPLENVHKLCANLFLILVILHIFGAIFDKLWHKNDTLDSIFSGYKTTQKQETISLTQTQKTIFSVYLFFLFVLFCYLLYPNNLFLRQHKQEFFTSSKYALYQKECGSCHIAYPPYLLPKSAWDSLLAHLENHFGDDAMLEEESHNKITKFLELYASEAFNTKISHTINKTSQEISITKYPYWEEAHQKIQPKVFATEEVKSKANCQTCHNGAESGIFSKRMINHLPHFESQ